MPEVENNYLHGEMVGMGVIAQLMMENNEAEARRAASFFARIGLPIHLGQMGLSSSETAKIDSVVAGAMTFQPLANFEFEATPERVKDAMLAADTVGQTVAGEVGDAAYRRLQAK